MHHFSMLESSSASTMTSIRGSMKGVFQDFDQVEEEQSLLGNSTQKEYQQIANSLCCISLIPIISRIQISQASVEEILCKEQWQQ